MSKRNKGPNLWFMGRIDYDPSEFYLHTATPTQRKRIERHGLGIHTPDCIKYDLNLQGTHCIYQTYLFWPTKPLLTIVAREVEIRARMEAL